MRPVDYARKYYKDNFNERLEDFLQPTRYLYSGDDFFVMAYPHNVNSLLERNINNEVDKLNCWVIHFFSGDINRLFDIAPFEMPYIVFQRRGKWKLYDTDKLKKKLWR